MVEKYSSKGMLGSYRTSGTQFPNPEGVKLFTGYGADEEDLVRGFCDPDVAELPEYDKRNYQDRYTLPAVPDEDQSNTEAMDRDFEFRTKDIRSKGFLTRPRIPTER